MRKSIAGLMIAGLCLAMVSVVFAAEIAETSIPQDDSGTTTPVYTGVGALLSLYDERANAMLPILPPDESGSVRQVIDFCRVTIDETADGYSESFLNTLSTKGVYNAHFNVITYPILILLDERTHDYILSAHDSTELLRVARPKDYDPLWYSIEYFKQRELKPTRKEFKEHTIMYNPARIVGMMELVNQEGAKAIAEIEAQIQAAITPLLPPAMMMSGGPYVGSLSVEGMQFNSPTNGDMTLTIGYPSGMEGVPLDIIGCDDLMNWNWSVLASTNAPSSTNRFNYIISPATTNRNFVTVYRTDVPAGDTDGDGVPDGEERYIDGTDSNDPDDPANIKGSIGYATDHGGGGQTGVIHVVAVTNLSDWSTAVSDSVAVTGAYHITKVPHGDYFIKAWRDSDGDGMHDTYEATGMYYTAAITVTSQWTGIDFTMTDPDSDADLMGDWWEVVYFQNLLESGQGDEDLDRLQNLYEYYAGTDPTDGFSDSDSDGMSDDWEDAFGLDKNDGTDADDDPDQDGFTSLAEYQSGSFGTDPQDNNSHPVYFVDVTATAFPGAGSLATSQNAAWGDYDNDGDPDLYLATGLWRNDSGTFTNIPNTAFGPGLWLDSNNDGYLDLFSWAAGSVTNWALYTNTIPSGTTGFVEDVSFPASPYDFSDPGFRSRAACPVDLDSDGHIDLYIGGYESWEVDYYSRISYRDTMVRNMRGINGSATPVWEISYQDGADWVSDIGAHQFRTTDKDNPARRTKGITACDYDEDGDSDIHVSAYRTTGNRMWSGAVGKHYFEAGGFLDLGGWGNSIGSAWGDLDNDGYFDLFTANLRHAGTPQYDDSQFFRNLGPVDGYRFSNMTDIVSMPWQEADSNPTMADFDRDGDLDLFVTCSTGGYPGRGRLFRNDGQWGFTEVTDSSGLPTNTTGQGTEQNAWADFDDDGALDLFTGGKLYRNQGDGGNWIKLELNGDGSIVNRAAVGTVVKMELDGKTLVRQVEGAVGEGNQNSPVLHFGLGTNAGPVNVTIRWPGHSAVVVTNLALNQIHTLNFAAPDNDDFANAVPLPGLSGRLAVRNGNATLETGEPEHSLPGYSAAKCSLWWRFSPPTNGFLTVRCPDEYTTYQSGIVLALYRGSVLTNLVSVKKSVSRGLYVLPVEVGESYRLVVADRLAFASNRTIPLEWSFETSGLWRVDGTYTDDDYYWPSEKWIQQAPSDTTSGTGPFTVEASDLPDGSGFNPARLIFWPETGTRTQASFLDAWGVSMDGMAEWQPATTGQMTHIDHIYLADGLGSARALYAGTNGSGDTAVLEYGWLSYGNGFDPGWWENNTRIYTNGYASGLYNPFKLVDDPSSVNMRIVWKGNPATTAAGTVLIQDVHHTQGVITQFVITCTSTSATELAHYHAFTNGAFMLTWQTDASPTNTAVLGLYSWDGTWQKGAEVPCVYYYPGVESAVPIAYIPVHGDEPQKILWSWKWDYSTYWESALVQQLGTNYESTAINELRAPVGDWDARPLRWDYLYDPGSGLESYFRLEWLVEY